MKDFWFGLTLLVIALVISICSMIYVSIENNSKRDWIAWVVCVVACLIIYAWIMFAGWMAN